MASYHIQKGKDIKLAGKPSSIVKENLTAATVTVFPGEFKGIKPKLLVKEGDSVRIGQPLFFDKKLPALQFVAPAAGKIAPIEYGERRSLAAIRIEVDKKEEAVRFSRNSAASLIDLPRKKVFDRLLKTGYLAYLIERPFSKIANPAHVPKSIFVNGMATAPHQADPNITLEGKQKEFQAGLDILTRLTEGPVHLCIHEQATFLKQTWNNVAVHRFNGPHPSGNTSVHIHHIDPIRPGDVVWTIKPDHVAAIGQLFLR
ncbi:MAG: NADH:ubiquinone reductase (Na(+)-transporting) subunit A, partial [Verrucomicrobiota bacterium]